MNRNTKTSSLTEAAMICGILVIMSMLSAYIFPFIDFLFPIPAIIFSKRRGFKYSSLAAIAASIIITIILGPANGLIYLVLYTPMAVAMSYLIDKDKKASTILLGGAIVMIISIVVSLIIISKVVGINVIEQLTITVKEMFNIQEKILNTIGTKEQIESLSDFYDLFLELLINLLPVAIMTFSLGLAYINYVLAQKLAVRFKIELKQLRDIAYFSLPKHFMLSIGVFLIVFFLLGRFNFPNIDIIIANIITIVQLALMLQGLAIAKYFMIYLRINGFFRVIVFLLIIFNPAIMFITSGIAVLDLIFDFRKLRTRI